MIDRAPEIVSRDYDDWARRLGLTRACVYIRPVWGCTEYAAVVFVDGSPMHVGSFGTLAEAMDWAHRQVYEAQFKAAFG